MSPADVIGLKDLVIRLSIAVLVGGTLGLNRELHVKPAGVRTHALVSLGAALVAVITVQTQPGIGGPDRNSIGRIIQGIMTGVGFLGAGVILRDKDGHVTGARDSGDDLGVCGLGNSVWARVLENGGSRDRTGTVGTRVRKSDRTYRRAGFQTEPG